MRDCNVITAALEDESPDNTVKCIYKEVVIVGLGCSSKKDKALESDIGKWVSREKCNPGGGFTLRTLILTGMASNHFFSWQAVDQAFGQLPNVFLISPSIRGLVLRLEGAKIRTVLIMRHPTAFLAVVSKGNGPSAITLSYLLSGRRPYYNRIPHPDPMLSARLIECTQKSLLHQDLPFLSQGLEGRSKNPISLLIDAMTHPGADMGLEWPSLLAWKKTTKSVDHVVIGKEDPGGTWHGIADHILTISPGRWMALPGLEFKEYHDRRAPASAVAKYYLDYVKKNDLGTYMAPRSTVTMIQPLCKTRKRARWKVWVTDANGGALSYECRHLVLATGASDKAGCLGIAGELLPFVCHDLKSFEERLAHLQEEVFPLCVPNVASSCGVDAAETSPYGQKGKSQAYPLGSHLKAGEAPVKPVPGSDAASNGLRDRELETSKGIVKIIQLQSLSDDHRDEYSKEYRKLSRLKASENVYEEKDVWYAGGSSKDKELDLPLNELKLTGGRVVSVQSEKDRNQKAEEESKRTVLVVGAGLSAADAILVAWSKNYSVVHAFRSPLTTAHLPAAMYPEYHELYQLMQGSSSRRDYHPLPGHQVIEIYKDNSVQVADSSGNKKTLKVFSVAILIGSQPDLFFLPKRLKNLGIDPNKPVDCKVNPVQIDPFNYKCVRAPPGLYALGPLVGDNFVRFLQGGAIAVAGHILKDYILHNSF